MTTGLYEFKTKTYGETGPRRTQMVKCTEYIQSKRDLYQKWTPDQRGVLRNSKEWSLLRRITNVCTCGHKTQPPKKGGQYEICTEYVKHGVQKYGSQLKANQITKWNTNRYVKIRIKIIYVYIMQMKSCKRLGTWSPLRRWRHTQHNTRRFQISIHPRTQTQHRWAYRITSHITA